VAEFKRFSLVKPTLQTRFHIDFNWWSQNDRNWRVIYLAFYVQNISSCMSILAERTLLIGWIQKLPKSSKLMVFSMC